MKVYLHQIWYLLLGICPFAVDGSKQNKSKNSPLSSLMEHSRIVLQNKKHYVLPYIYTQYFYHDLKILSA